MVFEVTKELIESKTSSKSGGKSIMIGGDIEYYSGMPIVINQEPNVFDENGSTDSGGFIGGSEYISIKVPIEDKKDTKDIIKPFKSYMHNILDTIVI